MKLAYADPPYLGCCGMYDHVHKAPYGCWDDVSTWVCLANNLHTTYPEGFAVSMTSGNLDVLKPLFPTARIASWVKPFASFKPGVSPAYTWEPVLFVRTRKHERSEPTVRDHLSCPITMKKGLTGAKPEAFCRWVLDLLGWRPGDTVDDLFPGTGVMGKVVTAAEMEIPVNAA